jgi:hypothetical protein
VNHFGQRFAFDEFHRDKRLAIGFVDFVDGGDVRMIQSRGGLGFAQETLLFLTAPHQIRGKKFQGDGALEFGILGFVDGAHAALPDLLGNSVV